MSTKLEHVNNIKNAFHKIVQLSHVKDTPGLLQLLAKIEQQPETRERDFYILLCVALIEEQQENHSKAFEIYANLLSHQSELSHETIEFALRKIASIALLMEDYSNGLLALETLALNYSPYYAPRYGEVLYLTGDIEKSLSVYQQHMQQFPEDIETIFKLAELQRITKNTTMAKELYEYILSKDPQYTPAKKRLENID